MNEQEKLLEIEQSNLEYQQMVEQILKEAIVDIKKGDRGELIDAEEIQGWLEGLLRNK